MLRHLELNLDSILVVSMEQVDYYTARTCAMVTSWNTNTAWCSIIFHTGRSGKITAQNRLICLISPSSLSKHVPPLILKSLKIATHTIKAWGEQKWSQSSFAELFLFFLPTNPVIWKYFRIPEIQRLKKNKKKWGQLYWWNHWFSKVLPRRSEMNLPLIMSRGSTHSPRQRKTQSILRWELLKDLYYVSSVTSRIQRTIFWFIATFSRLVVCARHNEMVLCTRTNMSQNSVREVDDLYMGLSG